MPCSDGLPIYRGMCLTDVDRAIDDETTTRGIGGLRAGIVPRGRRAVAGRSAGLLGRGRGGWSLVVRE